MITYNRKRKLHTEKLDKKQVLHKYFHKDHTFRCSVVPTAICLRRWGFRTGPFGEPSREEGRAGEFLNPDDEQEEEGDGSSFLQEKELTRLESEGIVWRKPSLAESSPPNRGTKRARFGWSLKGVGEEEYRSLSMASLVSLPLRL